MNKYVKSGVDSAKTTGLVLGGFIGGNVLSQLIKKDNWKINIAMVLGLLVAHGLVKQTWAKNLIMGGTVFYGAKALNNLTTEVVNGLDGVPQGVKDIINKYVPKLNGTDEDADLSGALSTAEQQLLATYSRQMQDRAPVSQPASSSKLFGLGTANLI